MNAVATGFGDLIDDRCYNVPDDDSDDGIREDSSGDGDDEDNSVGGYHGGVGWSKNFAPHFQQLKERDVLFLQQIVSRQQSGEGGYTWTTTPITRRVFDNNIPPTNRPVKVNTIVQRQLAARAQAIYQGVGLPMLALWEGIANLPRADQDRVLTAVRRMLLAEGKPACKDLATRLVGTSASMNKRVVKATRTCTGRGEHRLATEVTLRLTPPNPHEAAHFSPSTLASIDVEVKFRYNDPVRVWVDAANRFQCSCQVSGQPGEIRPHLVNPSVFESCPDHHFFRSYTCKRTETGERVFGKGVMCGDAMRSFCRGLDVKSDGIGVAILSWDGAHYGNKTHGTSEAIPLLMHYGNADTQSPKACAILGYLVQMNWTRQVKASIWGKRARRKIEQWVIGIIADDLRRAASDGFQCTIHGRPLQLEMRLLSVILDTPQRRSFGGFGKRRFCTFCVLPPEASAWTCGRPRQERTVTDANQTIRRSERAVRQAGVTKAERRQFKKNIQAAQKILKVEGVYPKCDVLGGRQPLIAQCNGLGMYSTMGVDVLHWIKLNCLLYYFTVALQAMKASSKQHMFEDRMFRCAHTHAKAILT